MNSPGSQLHAGPLTLVVARAADPGHPTTSVQSLMGSLRLAGKGLAVFLSLAWVGLVGVGVGSTGGFGAGFFFGVVPIALIWGIAWVVVGFQANKQQGAR